MTAPTSSAEDADRRGVADGRTPYPTRRTFLATAAV